MRRRVLSQQVSGCTCPALFFQLKTCASSLPSASSASAAPTNTSVLPTPGSASEVSAKSIVAAVDAMLRSVTKSEFLRRSSLGGSGDGKGGSEGPKNSGSNNSSNNDDPSVADPVDEITPRVRIFVAGMFIVSFILYKMAMPRGKHVGWQTVVNLFVNDKLKSIDVYSSYAEFSTTDGYVHVGLVGDQHTTEKLNDMQKQRDRVVAAKLASGDEASKQEIAQSVKDGHGTMPLLSYCGTPMSERLLTAFGVFAWIVPFVFFPTIALILTRAVGTAMSVSANVESKSKLLKKDFVVHTTSNTRFAHVAGMKEAKREVTEIVEFLKNPTKFTRLGAKIPTGALLMGPPGTGKTLLAKAVAGEAGIGFIPVCGSDFVELYVGMGALRVRQLFEVAKQQRCIVYIDEIDAIGLKRQGSGNGEKQEQEHTLNELLTQLDGFTSNRGEIMVLASTNVQREMLDPALIRPGRFDRLVHVDAPVISERIDIFKVHLANLTLIAPPSQDAAVASPAATSATVTAALATKTSEFTSPPSATEALTVTTLASPLDSSDPTVPRTEYLLQPILALARLKLATESLAHGPNKVLLASIAPLVILLSKTVDERVKNDAHYNSTLAKALAALHAANGGPDQLAANSPRDTTTFEKELSETITKILLIAEEKQKSSTSVDDLAGAVAHLAALLNKLAQCPEAGVAPSDWLSVMKSRLSQSLTELLGEVVSISEQRFRVQDKSELMPSEIRTKFGRKIEILAASSVNYQQVIFSLTLNAPQSSSSSDGTVTSNSAVSDEEFSRRRLAASLFSALEAHAATLLDIHVAMFKVKAASTQQDAAEKEFSELLLRLGEIVLQPAGYQLLPTTPVAKTTTSTTTPLDKDHNAVNGVSRDQVYEFDFSSTLAKKSVLEQELIEKYAKRMSDLCPGFVGADIANVCNEGAILAAREKAVFVDISHLERSIDRVIAGIEHRSRKLSDFEKNVVAHHEAGHAVAGWFLNLADPLMKVSIVPRGGSALGYAQYLPNENHLRSANEIRDSICVTLGGRVAEEIFFGHLSTGASDDLSKVTKSAYMYVSSFTASTVRPSPASDHTKYVKPFGSNLSNSLDDKAKELVDDLYRRTYDLLLSKKKEMELLAQHLLEHEVLTHSDVVRLIGARVERESSEKKKAV